MDDIASRVLAKLEPEGLDTEGQNWQQRKSVQTRITILEAAIDCLKDLKQHGSQKNWLDRMQSRDELYKTLDYDPSDDDWPRS
jgi:hypothetical protein